MFAPVVVFDGFPSAADGGGASESPFSSTVKPDLPPAGIGVDLAHGDFLMINRASAGVQSLNCLSRHGAIAAPVSRVVSSAAKQAHDRIVHMSISQHCNQPHSLSSERKSYL
jgi:hypothetical protein